MGNACQKAIEDNISIDDEDIEATTTQTLSEVLQRDFEEDLEIFLLNNVLLSIQFFENYKQ